jgi:hypothetical protein
MLKWIQQLLWQIRPMRFAPHSERIPPRFPIATTRQHSSATARPIWGLTRERCRTCSTCVMLRPPSPTPTATSISSPSPSPGPAPSHPHAAHSNIRPINRTCRSLSRTLPGLLSPPANSEMRSYPNRSRYPMQRNSIRPPFGPKCLWRVARFVNLVNLENMGK